MCSLEIYEIIVNCLFITNANIYEVNMLLASTLNIYGNGVFQTFAVLALQLETCNEEKTEKETTTELLREESTEQHRLQWWNMCHKPGIFWQDSYAIVEKSQGKVRQCEKGWEQR